MNRTIEWVVIVAAMTGAFVPALASLPGCSWFRSACEAAAPVVTTGDSYVADAIEALDEAARVAEQLPGDRAKNVLALIEQGRAVLVNSSAAIKSTCGDSPDWGAIFKDFAAVWSAIKVIVGVLGEPTGAALLEGRPTMHDPVAWRLGGGK